MEDQNYFQTSHEESERWQMQWLVWKGSHNLNEELEIIAYWQIILEVNFQPCTGYYLSTGFFFI